MRASLKMAPGAIELELMGDRELIALIKSLDKKLSDNLLFNTMKLSFKPLIEYAQSQLKAKAAIYGWRGLNKYADAIKFKRTKRYRPDIIGYVGPERGRGKKLDFWFAHMIEYGTSGIKEKKSKRNDIYRRGISSDFAGYVASKQPGERYRPPTPAMAFMRPAIGKYGKKTEETLVKNLRTIVYKTWARGYRKSLKK